MEKSLLSTTWYDKDDRQQTLSEEDSETAGGYETHLIPHISLPQRNQPANTGERSRLMSFASLGSVESCEDAGLTMALSKQEIVQSIIAAQQAQNAPTLTSISATFTSRSKDPYMQDQAAQILPESVMPEYTGRLVISPLNKRHSREDREIRHAQAQILVKTFVMLVLFTGVGGVIWNFFSHTTIYLLVMFVILAIMLGSILSNYISDYYQLNLNGTKTTLSLQAVKAAGNTDTLQIVHEPHFRTKSDTSGYLHTVKNCADQLL